MEIYHSPSQGSGLELFPTVLTTNPREPSEEQLGGLVLLGTHFGKPSSTTPATQVDANAPPGT